MKTAAAIWDIFTTKDIKNNIKEEIISASYFFNVKNMFTTFLMYCISERDVWNMWV